MSTHPVDRLLSQAGRYTSRARTCDRNHDPLQARAALSLAETMLALAQQARTAETVARFTATPTASLPGRCGAGR